MGRPKPHEKLLEALIADYREFGGKKENPNIAIVDWKGVSTFTEFEILRDYFESKGNKTLICDPRDLEYDGKKLYVGNFEIDIFYKRVLIHEFQDEFDADNPFSNAYRDGNIFMANSFRTKIPHKKASFAVVGDERFQNLFNGEQLEMIKKHIPWTRRVREMKTKFEETEIDLVEHLRKNREKFLLKPNDDYGGSGINSRLGNFAGRMGNFSAKCFAIIFCRAGKSRRRENKNPDVFGRNQNGRTFD